MLEPVTGVATSDVVGLCAGPCPRNVLQITYNAALGDVLLAAAGALQAGAFLIVVGMLIRRWRRAGAAARRALAPVHAAGAATVALAAAYGATRTHVIAQLAVLGVALTPFVFIGGLLRARLARSAVADLLVALERDSASTALRDALARALGDPTLKLVYWRPEFETYADLDGHRVDMAALEDRTVTVMTGARGPSRPSCTTAGCVTSASCSTPSAPPPASRWRTPGSMPSCTHSSRSCAARARIMEATPGSGSASSATSTTVRSSGW